MKYCYEYPRPTVTVDAAVVTIRNQRPEILLIRRKHDPFAGRFALPGGFLEMDEEPVVGAARELAEETGLTGIPLLPLFACGQTGRDPRARCITMVFGALVPSGSLQPKGADDADEAAWMPLTSPPEMAFDHERILAQLSAHIRWQATTACIGRNYLPDEFSAEALHQLHELFGVAPGPESAASRGMRLGILSPGAVTGNFRFSPLEVCSHPDYAPMIW
jgi:8-oxo-dGTP diphosphatase